MFADIDTVVVLAAIAAGAALMALINFTSFGSRKAANIAR